MAIAHALTDTTADIASATSTVTITKPTGAGASHVLVAVFVTEKGSNVAQTITPPAGWTAINTQFSQTDTSIEIACLAAYWALGNVASSAFTNSANGASVQQGWVCSAFTGVDLTTPIDATGITNSSTGASTLTTNLVTIATANAWHCIATGDWLGTSAQAATGFTVSENGRSNAATALLYNTTPKSIGSTGTVVVNAASGATQIILAMPFALRPAVTATFIAPPVFMVPQAVAHAANW